jgi:hypothetical protein
MDVLKSQSRHRNGSKRPSAGRRSFLRKTGAALSAVLAASVAGISKTKTDDDPAGRLSSRLGMLEDENAVRKLYRSYETYLDQGMYEEVVGLFDDDGELYFNGGLFLGKEKGIRRLYLGHFSEGLTGKKIEPAPGYEQQQETIAVSSDRRSAQAQFPFSMRVGTPMGPESTLVQMARLQGQGIAHWWESGLCESSYVKAGDAWKIQKIEYRTMLQANQALGWAYAQPIAVPQFSIAFPENPTGPDKIIAPKENEA